MPDRECSNSYDRKEEKKERTLSLSSDARLAGELFNYDVIHLFNEATSAIRVGYFVRTPIPVTRAYSSNLTISAGTHARITERAYTRVHSAYTHRPTPAENTGTNSSSRSLVPHYPRPNRRRRIIKPRCAFCPSPLCVRPLTTSSLGARPREKRATPLADFPRPGSRTGRSIALHFPRLESIARCASVATAVVVVHHGVDRYTHRVSRYEVMTVMTLTTV